MLRNPKNFRRSPESLSLPPLCLCLLCFLVALANANGNRNLPLTVDVNGGGGGSSDKLSDRFLNLDLEESLGLPRSLEQSDLLSNFYFVPPHLEMARWSMSGQGSECPYRLKPLVGIKAPMNATLTPEIHMYNPHERPLQILEIYSSGGEFQLELPTGGSEGPQNLWEIPPHTFKPVIRISFHGRTAGNHSAFIRIKIADQLDEALENILVIPVEFEIQPKQAAYASNPLADFGRLASDDSLDPLHFKLDMQVRRNGSEGAGEAPALIGTYLREIPGLSFDPQEASIVLDPRLFEQSATINDLLVVRSSEASSGEEFTVLVRAEIFKGGLGYPRNLTTFVGSTEEGQTQRKRVVVVRNNFDFPLVIYNVSLTEHVDETQLQISQVSKEILLSPGKSLDLVEVHRPDEESVFKTTLLIHTNVTQFELPVVSCSGILHVSTQQFELRLPEARAEYSLELDLGTVPFAEMSRDGYVLLRNDNPIPIKIINYYFKTPKNVYPQAAFMGCHQANSSGGLSRAEVASFVNATKLYFCRHLMPGETAVFQVAIQTYVAEPSVGALKIWTPYEVLKVTVKFRSSVGQLDIEQDQLKFKDCFPGKICTAVLSIRSSFIYSVHITAVKFTRPGFRFKDFNAKGTTIAGQTLTKVGRIYFEPSVLCKSACYIHRPGDLVDVDAIFPIGGNNNLLYDGVKLRQRTELFRQFRRQMSALSLTLYSEELPPLELDFSIDMEWPKLVQASQAPALAIEVGQRQRQVVTISNPTPNALLLDYFLSDPVYARKTQLSLPHEVIDVSSTSCYLTDRDVFVLPEGPLITPILLPPGGELVVPVDFRASQADKYCTLLHVRSNLTLYEAVWLTARAVQSQFRFGNRRPGSQTPLLFELTPELFEACETKDLPAGEDASQAHAVMTTRSFTARNSGAAPMRIEGFLINQQPCEDSGFNVNDCQGFELSENDSRKVEITFRSDFTASRVQATLTLLTNLTTSDINYQLLAQLPAESLEKCAATLPRPSWEPLWRNTAMVVLLVTYFLVLLAAFIEYRALMAQQSAYDAARYKGAVQPTFNLRNIAKMQLEESAAAASSAASATQAHKATLKNGQPKDLRKRTIGVPMTTKPAKPKSSWSSWSMNINMLQKATETPQAPAKPALVKPSISPPNESGKTSKKSTPSPQPGPGRLPQNSRKPKQTPSPVVAKNKVELVAPEVLPKATSTPSPSSHQQENVSPRVTLKSSPTEAVQKEREPKVLKEQNGGSLATKKLGKTPGRERRKELPKPSNPSAHLNGHGVSPESMTKRVEPRKPRKQLNFYGNGHVTEEEASAPFVSPASPAAVTPPVSADDDEMNLITTPWETSSRVSFSDVLQTKQCALIDDGLSPNWQTNPQLGPIGSKKQNHNVPQSLTSLWEPYRAEDMNTHSLFEEPPTQPTHEDHSQWERSELILKQQLLLQAAVQLQRQRHEQELQQQQEQQQQQHQQQQQQLHRQQEHSGNTQFWSNAPAPSTGTWTPLGGYSYMDSWQANAPINHEEHRRATVLRPPPGLEANYHGHGQHRHLEVLNSSSSNPHQNPHSPLMDNAEGGAEESPQHMPYDPFTSPSSIWSDNWRNNHNNSMN